MTSRVLNFLWLNLDLPALPDPEDGSAREPMPEKYIENVRVAGERNPETEVMLWIDSERLTRKQLTCLREVIQDGMSNVRLRDLRDIPAYDQEPLYNEGETSPRWRDKGQKSLIWRQVDAAKILISLQGKADQVFFADLDFSHFLTGSPEVQDKLTKTGLLIRGGQRVNVYENQLWGFTRKRHNFFKRLYAVTLGSAYKGENGWLDLVNQVKTELWGKEGLKPAEIHFAFDNDSSFAYHPQHGWSLGKVTSENRFVKAWNKLFRLERRRPDEAQAPPLSRFAAAWNKATLTNGDALPMAAPNPTIPASTTVIKPAG